MGYLQRKDKTQRFIGRTLHEHNSMVMRMLNEDRGNKRMFNHIKMLIGKEAPNDTAYKWWNSHGGCKLLCKLC